MKPGPESGISLLNTLAVVAIGASVVHVMLLDQYSSISRLGQVQAAAQAHVLAQGGVHSVALALKRDFLTAPEADHLGEDWAQTAQKEIALEFGTYKIEIQDARGRFNLNSLLPRNLVQQRLFSRLLATLDLPQSLAQQISRIVAQNGPLQHPDDLARFGIAASDLARIAPFVGAFQSTANININAAEAPILAALFNNPSAGQTLSARREAKGFLEPRDLSALGLVLPALGGFTSDLYDVRVTAQVGPAQTEFRRRLIRNPETGEITSRPNQ